MEAVHTDRCVQARVIHQQHINERKFYRQANYIYINIFYIYIYMYVYIYIYIKNKLRKTNTRKLLFSS